MLHPVLTAGGEVCGPVANRELTDLCRRDGLGGEEF